MFIQRALITLLFCLSGILVYALSLLDLNNPDSLVFDFAIRYVKQLSCNSSDYSDVYQRMKNDKVVILSGDIFDVCNVESSACTVYERQDCYEAVWTKDNVALLDIAFPKQYELLLDANQKDIEVKLKDYLQTVQIISMENCETDSLKAIGDGIFYSYPDNYFKLPTITDRKYLHQNRFGNMDYYADSVCSGYTVSNLLQGVLRKDLCMKITQTIYGFQKMRYQTSLKQWISYCIVSNMDIYVAVEDVYDLCVRAFVVAENKKLGFIHLLSVDVPKNVMEDDDALLNVKLNAFIPTHNVASYFYEKEK